MIHYSKIKLKFLIIKLNFEIFLKLKVSKCSEFILILRASAYDAWIVFRLCLRYKKYPRGLYYKTNKIRVDIFNFFIWCLLYDKYPRVFVFVL